MDAMTLTPTATATPVALPTAAPPAAGEPGQATPAGRAVETTPSGPPGQPGRFTRLWRGPEDDPAWARPALFALLVATALLYFWNLTANGWANAFYSAAVQAGGESWKAFLYGSSDAASSITVDKPPASLWFMALSVRVFGLSSFAILLPQVLMGIGTVGVVYGTVKRYFGAAAGLIGGVVMALTPIAVLMFRFNNPDALLTLLMALGAWATLRAIERGSIRWMVVVGTFIGFGFLTKTLQVLLVVPFLGIAYLVAADTTVRRRILGSLAGVGAMLVSAGWWVAIVELVPASMRPYIGGSQDNSFLSVTFGYNGFGRLTGEETGSVGGGGGNGGGTWGATGLFRLFNGEIGGQITWLIPSVLILTVVGLVLRGRMPRTDLRRATYLVFGGWLLVTALVFSFMQGIFHAYYTIALAPAVAALVGMGAVEAWERRSSAVGSIALAAATAAAATWGFILLSRTSEYGPWLRILVLAIGMALALLLLAVTVLHQRAVPLVVGGALVASLLGPAAYTVTTVSASHSGSIVTAGPSTGGMGGGPGGMPAGRGGFGGAPGATQNGTGAQGGTGTQIAPTQGGRGGMGGLLDASAPSTEVVAALSTDADTYTWVAATVGSQNAAGLQLGTQLPVMAIGGFNGSDPSPTPAQFQAYVQAGQIHYFYGSGGSGGFGGGMGGSGTGTEITQWVQANFTAVQIGGETFYDLTQPLATTGG